MNVLGVNFTTMRSCFVFMTVLRRSFNLLHLWMPTQPDMMQLRLYYDGEHVHKVSIDRRSLSREEGSKSSEV